MTVALDESQVRALLLDIEGTTTPIDFVTRTLYPYARQRLEQFLQRSPREPSVSEAIDGLRKQPELDAAEKREPPLWKEDSPEAKISSAIAYARWLMDRDSKCTALKSLQGKIWREGYEKGELRGEVFPDVPAAFARWSQQGKRVSIFSSGSVLAQKLLFATTTAGDLSQFIQAYFDTTTGVKTDPQSYLRIAGALALTAREILFISDVVKELDAAIQAGMQTALCVRTQFFEESGKKHGVIRSFEEVFP
ncbi:MAG: acireductone synthase [Candidatus Acidiferrales bacterium]